MIQMFTESHSREAVSTLGKQISRRFGFQVSFLIISLRFCSSSAKYIFFKPKENSVKYSYQVDEDTGLLC
jgi:hypothetical protein